MINVERCAYEHDKVVHRRIYTSSISLFSGIGEGQCGLKV